MRDAIKDEEVFKNGKSDRNMLKSLFKEGKTTSKNGKHVFNTNFVFIKSDGNKKERLENHKDFTLVICHFLIRLKKNRGLGDRNLFLAFFLGSFYNYSALGL